MPPKRSHGPIRSYGQQLSGDVQRVAEPTLYIWMGDRWKTHLDPVETLPFHVRERKEALRVELVPEAMMILEEQPIRFLPVLAPMD